MGRGEIRGMKARGPFLGGSDPYWVITGAHGDLEDGIRDMGGAAMTGGARTSVMTGGAIHRPYSGQSTVGDEEVPGRVRGGCREVLNPALIQFCLIIVDGLFEKIGCDGGQDPLAAQVLRLHLRCTPNDRKRPCLDQNPTPPSNLGSLRPTRPRSHLNRRDS